MKFTIRKQSEHTASELSAIRVLLLNEIKTWVRDKDSSMDRGHIATIAANESNSVEYTIEGYIFGELVAIATMRNSGKLLNLASKRKGFGWMILQEVCKIAIANDNELEFISVVDENIQNFYRRNGAEMDETYFGNESNGVRYLMSTDSMEALIDGHPIRCNSLDTSEFDMKICPECGDTSNEVAFEQDSDVCVYCSLY